MGTDAALRTDSEFEQLRFARDVIECIGRAVLKAAGQLDRSFCQAVRLLWGCRGTVIVTGIGKAGLIGQKISATLASTGTPSYFLHPAEAVHGDLGRIRQGDVAVVLSASGETEEVVRLLPFFREFGIPVIAITGREDSRLGRAASAVISLGNWEEAGHLRLAPTTSAAVMLAIGDALALTVCRLRGFKAEDFARFHPGGSLGRKLGKVEDQMRPLSQCRLAPRNLTIRQVIIETKRPGRRTGAVMLVDEEGRLAGIFTDSDLAKLLESRRDSVLDEPISQHMTHSPITVPLGTPLREAVAILAQRKISELPVVDLAGRPCGILDITDIIGLFPEACPSEEAPEPTGEGSSSHLHGEGGGECRGELSPTSADNEDGRICRFPAVIPLRRSREVPGQNTGESEL